MNKSESVMIKIKIIFELSKQDEVVNLVEGFLKVDKYAVKFRLGSAQNIYMGV